MRSLLAPLLLVALAAVPAAGNGAADTAGDLDVAAYRLDNGLRVILHEDHASPTVVVYVWYHVGSKDEKPGKTGFAHLFEHLMFKGSKHVPDGRFDELLEAAGGWNNGTTSADRTNYFEQLPAHQLPLALYLEADRMAGLWATMSQEKLDNQRDVVKNERRQSYENRPYGVARLEVQQALWPEGHGNHNLTIGTMEDLTAASMADVEAFYRAYYVPNNATLVIAGDIDKAETRKLVDRYFGWIPRRPDPPHVTLEGEVTPMKRAARLTETDRVQATKLTLAWRSPTPFTRGSRDLEVAAQILAGGKSSRLYKTLVFDKRLCDWVRAYQSPEMLGGEFQIDAMLKQGSDPGRVRALIDTEVAKLGLKPPGGSEHQRALRMLEVDLLQGLESLYVRANQLAEYDAYTGRPDFLGRDLEMLRQTKPAGVSRAVARWLRPDARVIMTVTPAEGGAK
jgi:zinc protease